MRAQSRRWTGCSGPHLLFTLRPTFRYKVSRHGYLEVARVVDKRHLPCT